MSKFNNVVIGGIFLVMASAAQSGPGGGHSHSMDPINESQAVSKADDAIGQMVDKQQLDEGWGDVSEQSVETRDGSSGKVWVVQYENPEVSDTDKQKLFVIIDEMGNFVTANHSGNL